MVILNGREAFLIAHVLAVFERLLRQGDLQPDQLRHLIGGEATGSVDQADVEMAEVVAEAAAALRNQL